MISCRILDQQQLWQWKTYQNISRIRSTFMRLVSVMAFTFPDWRRLWWRRNTWGRLSKGIPGAPCEGTLKMLSCPRPQNKSVLLEKFWNFVHFNRFDLTCVDSKKHVPFKRWLLDVLSTFTLRMRSSTRATTHLKEYQSYLRSRPSKFLLTSWITCPSAKERPRARDQGRL